MNRCTDRNNLPIIANPLTDWQKDRETYLSTFAYKAAAFLGVLIFAQLQFSKAYFPYGIILRRSIPTTWAQYASHRGPIGAVFLYAWYRQREFPRKERIDLTDDSEN